MIITVTMNPAIDKTAQVKSLVVYGLNRLEKVILDVGGKGINVSKAIKELGGESIVTGLVGGTNGQWIESQLQDMGLKHDFMSIDGNTRINLKVLDQNMKLTELNEAGNSIDLKDLDIFKTKLIDMVSPGDIVVLAGSVPQNTPTTIYATLTKDLKAKGAKVILDADGDLFKEGVEAIPSIIKPNKYELCKYFKLDEDVSDIELIDRCRPLLYKGIELIVVSLGSKGALFITSDDVATVPGLKVRAHSAVGAGDSMVGALAYALEQNMELIPMIKLAVATSAGAVMTQGTKPQNRSVIDMLMKEVVINFRGDK